VRFFLLAGLVAAVGYASALLLSNHAHKAGDNEGVKPEPPLLVPPTELEIGRLFDAQVREQRFHVANTGDEPITIDRFLTSCDCLEIRPAGPLTLLPGQSTEFRAVIRGLLKQPVGAPPASETVEVGVRANLSAGGRDRGHCDWTFRAIVVPTLRVARRELAFGTVSERLGGLEGQMDIQTGPEVSRISCEAAPNWTRRWAPVRVDGEWRHYRLTVRSAGPLRPKTIADSLRVTPYGREGQPLPTKSLEITGRVVHDVVAVPPEVFFGRQDCGRTGTDTLALRSLTGRKFRIAEVSPGSADMVVAGGRDPSGEAVYTVRWRLTKAGDQRSGVAFTVIEGDGRRYVLTVPLAYFGAPRPSRSLSQVGSEEHQ
jgi:hypothetical protein